MTQKIQVTKKCEAFEAGGLVKVKGPFDVPEATAESVSLYAASTDIVQSPNDGCTQQFAIQADSANNIQIDASSGVLTLTNDQAPIGYDFSIIVTNTGGTTTLDSGEDVTATYNPTLTISGFSVST